MVIGNRPRGVACSRYRMCAAVAAGLVLLAGCSRGGPDSGSPSAGELPRTAQSPTAPLLADQNAAPCRSFNSGLASARTPLDAMRSEAVLLPFVDLIELSTRQTAQTAASAPDPVVADAMREVVGAIDDLDAQGRAALPAGADPTKTTVRLNPDRLGSALDGAARACASHLPVPVRPIGH